MAGSLNNLINAQGTILYVLPVPATPFADCTAAVTAIKAGKQVLCPQDLGEITRTRDIKEYSCLSSNDVLKSAGAMKLGEVTVGMLLDPDDISGQTALYDAMEANDTVIFAFELANADTTLGDTDASGTIFWYTGVISGDGISIAMDEAVLYSSTISLTGTQNKCAAIAGSA